MAMFCLALGIGNPTIQAPRCEKDEIVAIIENPKIEDVLRLNAKKRIRP